MWCVLVLVAMVTRGVWGQVKDSYHVPQSQYDYYTRRQALQDAATQLAGWRYSLTQDDEVVERYLQYLKWQQFMDTKDTGFYPSRPIEDVLDNVTRSPLYEVLRQLPKGGNMHSHENHQVSKRKLLEIVWQSRDFEHLWILPANHSTSPWKLDFFLNPPSDQGWIKVKDNQHLYNIDNIYQNQVLMHTMSEDSRRHVTDAGERWRQMGPLWDRGSSQLINNYVIKEKYVEAMYVEQAEEGVQYYESRHSLSSSLYVLDPNANDTYGKRSIDPDGRLDINLTLSVLDKVKQRYPHFIGHKRMYGSRRQRRPDQIKTDMARIAALRQAYPHFILGYDLVSEEDLGHSLLYHLDSFLSITDGQAPLPLFFHAGETSWLEDLVSSNDVTEPVATIENLLDVVLLNTRRIGHGIALAKYPHLLSVIKERGIAIEVCPISNQILGYTPDLRNHPAVTFLRSGNALVLGADDPGTFGYDSFTVDWHHAYMAWGLTLSDLKTLAYNSLIYSGMTSQERAVALDKWTAQWNHFAATVKTQACSTNFNTTSATYGKLFPNQLPNNQSVNVTVYGRNFQSAICQKVVCKFGDVISAFTRYVTNFKLVCQSPEGLKGVVPVSVSLDGGVKFSAAGSVTYVTSQCASAVKQVNDVTLLLLWPVALLLVMATF